MKLKLKNNKNKVKDEENVYLLIEKVNYTDPETDVTSKQNIVVGEISRTQLQEEITQQEEQIKLKEEAFNVIKAEHEESIKSFENGIKKNKGYIKAIRDEEKK